MVEMSVSLEWGKGRGEGMETGTEGMGKEGSVEPGRTEMNQTGCLLGNPEAQGLPSLSRWVVRQHYEGQKSILTRSNSYLLIPIHSKETIPF